MFVQPLLPWKSNNYYSETVFVALVIQHVKHMHCIILSSVDSLKILKICPVGAKLFHADRWMDRQTWQS